MLNYSDFSLSMWYYYYYNYIKVYVPGVQNVYYRYSYITPLYLRNIFQYLNAALLLICQFLDQSHHPQD